MFTTEVVIFVFMVIFSDAPPVLTGMNTRAQCEAMRASIEPEILKLSQKKANITPCIPVSIKLVPQA